MSSLLAWVETTQTTLFQTQVHSTFIPFSLLDTLGALRLAVFLEQFIRQRNNIDADSHGIDKRGGYLSECLGIFLLIFGGETLLGKLLKRKPNTGTDVPHRRMLELYTELDAVADGARALLWHA